MKKQIRYILILVISIFLCTFSYVFAVEDNNNNQSWSFKAEVIQVTETSIKIREDGSSYKQQNLKLLALDGPKKGQEIEYKGISEIEVANINEYDVGDKVFVDGFVDESGQEVFYVADYVRTGNLYFLSFIFLAVVFIIGRRKGFRAILSLIASFLLIVYFILPRILSGADPFVVSLLGGLAIMAAIIYITDGFKRKSHIAVVSVLFSLAVTLILSLIFVSITRLSGMAQEDTAFLVGIGGAVINFKGLLLAGFVIGAIGVLDDIIVGQIEAVNSLREANPLLPAKKIFHLAYRVGNTHLGAIINTLFLTYAGASLPLLLLFIINSNNGISLERFINNEAVSTEIIRTLVGSIGVMLSMPIATFLASFFPGRDRKSIDK